MSRIEGALVLSFEPGLNAHAGVYAQKVNSWSEFKMVCKELKKPAVQEKFKCVCFDTIDIAAQLCQEYICAQAGVQSLGDIAYGKLYEAYRQEFSKAIRGLVMLGYGAIFACHTETKDIGVPGSDAVIERLQPKLDKRAFDVINSLVDIIGIGVMEFDEKGQAQRKLITAETPTVRGGNRFGFFPPVIDFSYEAVLNALCDAIEKEGEVNKAQIVDKVVETHEEIDYDAVRAEAMELWTKLVGTGDNLDEDMARRIMKKVEMIFGRQIRLSEITEDQKDLYQLVILEMRELAENK